MHLKVKNAFEKIQNSKKEFLNLFEHGTLSVEIYKPNKVDKQTPHDRDEVYVVISGSGEFINENKIVSFETGDFLFVSAGNRHRFINFTENFTTWVIFYGSVGGEIIK
jgi:mannose-6-phosphate isomerase-like protein (cupin superfamily)